MLVEKIVGKAQDYNLKGLYVSRVVLDRYDINKPHQKLTSDTGEQIAISLEDGETLFDGAVLYKDDSRVIMVELATEDLLIVYPEGNREWAKAAFNIGNMHQAAYIQEDCIKIPYDAIMEKIIKRIGVKHFRVVGKLDGERANVNADHSHKHSRNHNNHHHHEHEQR